MAAAASAEMWTRWLRARRAGFKNGPQIRSGKAAFIFDDLRFDGFAGQGEGDEDGFAVGARKARSAVDGLFDVKSHANPASYRRG